MNRKGGKQFSSERQPSKESRIKQAATRRYTKQLEYSLLDELFKPDISVTDENGKPFKISSIEAGIKRLKKIMLTTKDEKLATDIFFKFMNRMFGQPVATVEASVEKEIITYSREEVIKMILEARDNKTIDLKLDEPKEST